MSALRDLWWLVRFGYWTWHRWPSPAWSIDLLWHDGPWFGIRLGWVSLAASPISERELRPR